MSKHKVVLDGTEQPALLARKSGVVMAGAIVRKTRRGCMFRNVEGQMIRVGDDDTHQKLFVKGSYKDFDEVEAWVKEPQK